MGYFMNRKRAQCQANTTDSIVLDKAKDQLNKTLDSREIYATSTAVSELTSNFERERERELILFSAKRILFLEQFVVLRQAGLQLMEWYSFSETPTESS